MMYEAGLPNLGTHGIWCQARQITSFSWCAVGKPFIPLRDRYLMPSNWAFSTKNGVMQGDQVDCIAGQYLFYYYVTGKYLLSSARACVRLRKIRERKNIAFFNLLLYLFFVFFLIHPAMRGEDYSVFLKSSPWSNFLPFSMVVKLGWECDAEFYN